MNADPHRRISSYEYPELYDFFQSRVLDRDAQIRMLQRFQPEDATRVLELGCGTGPLLARIEDDYEEVVGVDLNENMLRVAEERLTSAKVVRADFTDWSADDGRAFDVAVLGRIAPRDRRRTRRPRRKHLPGPSNGRSVRDLLHTVHR